MNRNDKTKDKREGKGRKPYPKRRGNQAPKDKEEKDNDLLNPAGRDNDPNWYFTDRALADQVTQLSFQNLAGYPLSLFNQDWDVPNLVRIEFNPCPGVIRTQDYGNTMLNKTNGANLAGFRLFSTISAYTGRVATYGPQDITTMILAFGELISVTEWIRRVFGVANTMSMRNRSYPRDVLNWGMLVDENDFYANFSNYRTRFNALITMLNQLPIPKGITYFDKCAAMYEKIYLDQPSSMAQTLIPNIWTTWILDETSYSGGTILKTLQWHANENNDYYSIITAPRTMGDYLDLYDNMIGAMLNSSSLQVVYTDLLNLAVKTGQTFWKLDYLSENYAVGPEYSQNFMLQMHNATVSGAPRQRTLLTNPHVTPYNDVYPDPTINTIFYNPGFPTLGSISNGLPRTGYGALIDMLSDNPTVEDRVEVTRYTSIGGTYYYTSGISANTNDAMCDAILPDHYCVQAGFRIQTPSKQAVAGSMGATLVDATFFSQYASYISNIDWAPRIYEVDLNTNAFTGNYVGDLNFYTSIDDVYLRKLHLFVTLGLYILRKGKA